MKEEYYTNSNIIERASEILKKVQKYSKPHQISIKKNKVGLLVTDMQNFFLDKTSHAFIPSSIAIIENIRKLQKTCQYYNIPVIFTQHINSDENAGMMNNWWRDIIRDNSTYSKINKKILIKDSIIIKKSQYDSFYKTNLQNILIKAGISQLIVTGVMTNLCCETTVRSAFIRGFEPFLPIDTSATYTFDYHLSTIYNLSFGFTTPLLSGELIKAIEYAY
ncbi:MAG: isochorismatase family protein [Bacteroidales bacterium]|nr:isochorismatase family protein [Bacteroidales bacterium]